MFSLISWESKITNKYSQSKINPNRGQYFSVEQLIDDSTHFFSFNINLWLCEFTKDCL